MPITALQGCSPYVLLLTLVTFGLLYLAGTWLADGPMDTNDGLLREEAASPHVAADHLLHEVSTHLAAQPRVGVIPLSLLSDLARCRWSIRSILQVHVLHAPMNRVTVFTTSHSQSTHQLNDTQVPPDREACAFNSDPSPHPDLVG